MPCKLRLSSKLKLRILSWAPVKQKEQTTTLEVDTGLTKAPKNKRLDQLVTFFTTAEQEKHGQVHMSHLEIKRAILEISCRKRAARIQLPPKARKWSTSTTKTGPRVMSRSFQVKEMMDATEKGDLATIKKLIAKDAKLVNCQDRRFTALISASREGHLEIVEFLLSKGASIDVVANV
ncbi:hypothetical protein As57867_023145, partial [Aphanomyces stellatus]